MSIQETTQVRTVSRDDEQRAIDTLILAFSSDPILRWFYPNAHDYLQSFPEFIERYAGAAFDQGTAYSVQDFSAVSLWLPSGVSPDEETMIELFQTTLSKERQEQALSVLEQLDGYHPSEEHWHLPVIGTDPTKQRKGSGSALMKHALAICDEEGCPAYLESSNPENISLYVRHGFEIVGTVHGETMPPIIPMVRDPQT